MQESFDKVRQIKKQSLQMLLQYQIHYIHWIFFLAYPFTVGGSCQHRFTAFIVIGAHVQYLTNLP